MPKSLHINIGLKLFSTNMNLIPAAVTLYEEGVCQYIELYALPDSLETTISSWQGCPMPLVIHAPHSDHGMNLSVREQETENRLLFEETRKFADVLAAQTIIVHGGHSGTIDETLRQIAILNDHRICLENKPPLGLNNKPCVGCFPDEFAVARESGVLAGTVLDFGHASCAAFSCKKEPLDLVHEFLQFGPRVFHISDSWANSAQDCHLHLGQGNLDIGAFLSVLPTGAMLTLETPRSDSSALDEFIVDVQFVRDFYQQEGTGR